MKSLILSSLLISTALAGTIRRDATTSSISIAQLGKPALGSRFQIVLNETIDVTQPLVPSNVDIFDVDLFDTPDKTIEALKNQGKKVICYFSAGSYEDWRPDFKSFEPKDLGGCMKGWHGEKWLDIRRPNVLEVMKARVRFAKQQGCDGIDPDNIDVYDNTNGVGNGKLIKRADSVDFLKKLADEARSLGMWTGLKNAQAMIPDVKEFIQFAVNEECNAPENNECGSYKPLTDKNIPVFHIEYVEPIFNTRNELVSMNGFSDTARMEALKKSYCPGLKGFSTVIKNKDLDGFVLYCDKDLKSDHTATYAPKNAKEGAAQKSCQAGAQEGVLGMGRGSRGS